MAGRDVTGQDKLERRGQGMAGYGRLGQGKARQGRALQGSAEQGRERVKAVHKTMQDTAHCRKSQRT